MLGLHLHQGLNLREDLPRPEPLPGEALVRVRLAGICATDLQLLQGYYPFNGILGHEFVGEVEACEAAPEWIGRRVVGEINIACGHCPACRAGRDSHCRQRQVLGIRDRNGAFAEYLCLPLSNLHAVPDAVSDEAAVFTEPLAAALRIAEQVRLGPSQRVLVVGAGRLGQLIARVLRLSGCELRVVARYARQRRLLEQAGLSWLDEADAPEGGFDLVVEASGSPGGFELARRALRAGGCLVLKSTFKGEIKVNLSALVVDEIQVLGSRCGPFSPALRLLEQGLVDPTPLIDERYPLSQGLAAIGKAGEPGVMKVLLENPP